MHEHTFIVPEDSTPDRVDKILAAHYPEVSRAAIQRFIESGKICRKNGDRLEPKKKLHPGEILLVDLSPVPIVGLRPVDLPIGILYEDESLIVVDKPSGMVVHPGDGTGEDTCSELDVLSIRDFEIAITRTIINSYLWHLETIIAQCSGPIETRLLLSRCFGNSLQDTIFFEG